LPQIERDAIISLWPNRAMLNSFDPAVSAWFRKSFSTPTPCQLQAWPAIQSGRDVLVAAPTGSGKTLAGFLAAIDGLVRQAAAGALVDATQVIYVSPLKALANDIQRNLLGPLEGIRAEIAAQGRGDIDIRASVRTGDTPQTERARMRRQPPHIVVTTPESLYILLTSESGREMLKAVKSVIVDEIHALAPNKRGAHLALTLARLQALTGAPLTRVGLSATQKPIDEVARFLVGTHASDAVIVDAGHVRERDLALEVPPAPLETVMSGEIWQQVYDRLAALIAEHRTTLIFANTRRMVERITHHLSERVGMENVAAHHGSLSREQRLDAEQRLKHGQLKALVATASLELGIDIGDVDLVCQLGSPRAIAAFLQRVGATPKGRLFPLSRDDLIECAALIDCVQQGELDRLSISAKPADVLAQQMIAEVASREWREDELFDLFRGTYPFRDLTREEWNAVVEMVSEGINTRRGRRAAYIHRDAINGVLNARRGARLTSMTSGGTIPDTADYRVVLEPQAQFIGTVNEDFAIESLAGDVFQLGNHSYRIQRVERGLVRVEDAQGAPPNIPFWIGEAPARSDELTQGVSRLRAEIIERCRHEGRDACIDWLASEVTSSRSAAEQAVDYLASAAAALGTLPSQDTVVMERFFDEAGGMHLVIHSLHGSRVNRAWGLALRKRFCRRLHRAFVVD
jgi:ATP-dependent helicase Lhr and Lhr-like helicase